MKIPRRLRELGKASLHRVFEAGQRLGVDVLPRSFYSSIPDLAALKSTDDWRRPLSMVGVAGADLDHQLAFVAACCPEPLRARTARGDIAAAAWRDNGEPGFGVVEADFLHCFIASKRPRKVVQVGSGVSTAVILRAAEEAGFPIEVVAIDPYPTPYLEGAARAGRIRLIAERAQAVASEELLSVGEGGLLFVDSTHTVQPGGEVNRILLEIVPRLPARCHVHFHDIYFPYDYPTSLLTELFFPSESTLLHALLVHNARMEISASLSMLHHGRPDELRRWLPGYDPRRGAGGLAVAGEAGHFPSSTYLWIGDSPPRAPGEMDIKPHAP
jgi:Methyltransferase domain